MRAPGGGRPAAPSGRWRLLDVDPGRVLELPNGFDPRHFTRRDVDRREVWRRDLVLEPRGWLPDQEPGSVAYRDQDLELLARPPVLVAVGRFTEVKRLGLLISAHARARDRLVRPAPLVLVGGYPGEWEVEHPADTIARLGARDVFLAGWHEQEELPELLSAADVLIMPSAREHFGQVLVEAMACELAPIAARSPGPESIIEDGRTGWLVPVDDEQALADAIVQAVSDDGERRPPGRRGPRGGAARILVAGGGRHAGRRAGRVRARSTAAEPGRARLSGRERYAGDSSRACAREPTAASPAEDRPRIRGSALSRR